MIVSLPEHFRIYIYTCLCNHLLYQINCTVVSQYCYLMNSLIKQSSFIVKIVKVFVFQLLLWMLHSLKLYPVNHLHYNYMVCIMTCYHSEQSQQFINRYTKCYMWCNVFVYIIFHNACKVIKQLRASLDNFNYLCKRIQMTQKEHAC